MGFEQAQEAMDSAESASSSTGTTDLAPESTQADNKSVSDLIDIGSLDKFRFKDKELTPKELEKSFMLQKDYSRKTQELAKEREKYSQTQAEYKAYQEEKKFSDNLNADLKALIKDPSLVSEFLKIYPQKYHQYLDLLPQNTLNQMQGQQQQTQDPQLLRKIHEIESKVLGREQKEEAILFQQDSKLKESQLDAADAKFSAKYKWADPEVVLSKLSYLNDRGTFGDPKQEGYMDKVVKTYESIWKQDHEKNLERYGSWNKEQAREQKRANSQGKDMGQGGQTPSQAPSKMKLKDVKNHIINGM